MLNVLKRQSIPFVVLGLIAGACALFYVALLVMDAISARFGLSLLAGYEFSSMIVVSIGIVGVNFAVLIIEWLNVGWKKCALKRLLFLETSTVRTDLFYLVLRLSGLNYAISFVLSFGLVFVAANQLGMALDFDLLEGMPNLFAQFGVIVIVNSFVFYWAHRLMHSSALFEIHKVHHSALELNVLTPTRNHPVDFLIMIVINTIPASILGADPLVISAYLGINGLYQCAVHSDITFLENRFVRAIIVTPAAHRIHHSELERHYDKNFGILTFWDAIFGTYYSPLRESSAYDLGVKNNDDFNTDHPIKELIMVMVRWVKGLPAAFGFARS